MKLRVIFDACVLYPASLRDLLLSIAYTDAVFPLWSDDIHDEWMNSLLDDRPDLDREDLEETRQIMNRKFPHSLVRGYHTLIETLQLPDPDDRHVLAAAIHAKASLIVTLNLKDFPRSALEPRHVETVSPDDFVCRVTETDPELVCQAVKTLRARLKNPPKSVEEYIDSLRRQGLTKTVAFLEQHRSEI